MLLFNMMSIVMVIESCAHCKSIASFQWVLGTGSALITVVTDTMLLKFVILVVLLYFKYAKTFSRTGSDEIEHSHIKSLGFWFFSLSSSLFQREKVFFFFQIAVDTVVKVNNKTELKRNLITSGMNWFLWYLDAFLLLFSHTVNAFHYVIKK